MSRSLHPFPHTEGEPLSHDKIARTLLEHFFKDLIEIMMPSLAEIIAWDTLVFEAREQFAKFTRHGGRIPDIIAKVGLVSGEEQLLILNVEIEARARGRAKMEERLWNSLIRIYLKYEHPVVSAVVYLKDGKPGVTKETAVREVDGIKAWSFEYFSLGLSGALAEEWLKRPQALVAALAAWMGSKEFDPVEKKILCLEKIVASDLGERGRYLLANTVEKYVQLDEQEEARYRARLESEKKEVREMVITWDDAVAYWLQEGEKLGEERGVKRGVKLGEKRGEKRGVKLGEKRGALAATRKAILLMAHQRPENDVPADFEARLEAVDKLERLHEILENVLRVRRLDDLNL